MTAPLLLLSTGEAAGRARAERFLQAAAMLAQPAELILVRETDAIDMRAASFALACSAPLALTAARLNDRFCTGGLSARMVAHLRGSIGLSMLAAALRLPLLPAGRHAVRRIEHVGLLLTGSRAQIFWRADSDAAETRTIAATDAAARLAPAAIFSGLTGAGKGWGRCLLHLRGIETEAGFYLGSATPGIPDGWDAMAMATAPDFHRRLLAALLAGAPLDMTPPAPVIVLDAAGGVTLCDRPPTGAPC